MIAVASVVIPITFTLKYDPLKKMIRRDLRKFCAPGRRHRGTVSPVPSGSHGEQARRETDAHFDQLSAVWWTTPNPRITRQQAELYKKQVMNARLCAARAF